MNESDFHKKRVNIVPIPSKSSLVSVYLRAPFHSGRT